MAPGWRMWSLRRKHRSRPVELWTTRENVSWSNPSPMLLLLATNLTGTPPKALRKKVMKLRAHERRPTNAVPFRFWFVSKGESQ